MIHLQGNVVAPLQSGRKLHAVQRENLGLRARRTFRLRQRRLRSPQSLSRPAITARPAKMSLTASFLPEPSTFPAVFELTPLPRPRAPAPSPSPSPTTAIASRSTASEPRSTNSAAPLHSGGSARQPPFQLSRSLVADPLRRILQSLQSQQSRRELRHQRGSASSPAQRSGERQRNAHLRQSLMHHVATDHELGTVRRSRRSPRRFLRPRNNGRHSFRRPARRPRNLLGSLFRPKNCHSDPNLSFRGAKRRIVLPPPENCHSEERSEEESAFLGSRTTATPSPERQRQANDR